MAVVFDNLRWTVPTQDRTIIAGEYDQRLLGKPVPIKGVQHLAHGPIQLSNKVPINADLALASKAGAKELASQLEEITPSQPLSRLKECRRRCREISKILSESKSSYLSSTGTDRLLKRIARDDIPPEVKAVLLRTALKRLEQQGLASVTRRGDNSPAGWRDWWTRYRRLETARREALAAGPGGH